MSIAHKYIDKSIFSGEVSNLFNLFTKIYYYENPFYKSIDKEEEEILEYFCSIGLLKKVGVGLYHIEPECPILDSFHLFLNCLTNKLSIPYSEYCSTVLDKKKTLPELRLSLSAGILHGDFIFNAEDTYPYIICAFNKIELDNEPMCLHPDFVGVDCENIDKAFTELSLIKHSTPKCLGANRYFVWDRKRKVFVFESKEDKDVFEGSCPFYKEYPKECKENTEIEQFMNNPTEEGANKIIESLKADLQDKYPDMEINIEIAPLGKAEPQPLKPIEPENITKTEEDNKDGFTYLLNSKYDTATIFKNSEFYCTLPRNYNETTDCFLSRIKEFLDKLNS